MKHPGAGEADLLTRRLAGVHDPVALFAALEAEGRASMLFRRTGGQALIMVDAAVTLEARAQQAHFRAESEAGRLILPVLAERLSGHVSSQSEDALALTFTRSDDPDDAVREEAATALDALRALARGVTSRDGEEPFALAALGIIGFDHVDMIEALPARMEGDFPDLYFQLAETLIVIEENGAARVLALAMGSDDAAAAHRQQSLAAERLARVVARIEQARVPDIEQASAQQAQVDTDDESFGAAVLRMKEHIAAGDIFQVVPSRTFSTSCTNAVAAFRRLIAADPSAYHFLIKSPFGTLLGASPETAVDVHAGTLSISPIAGTRPRGASADEDDRQEADLRLDAKEVAEHLMLVDLARNDVARIAVPGSRRVTSLLRVERFAKVMHLVSTVEGQLPDGRDAVDAVRACMNVGTLSGAPKLKAIELIRSVEQKARGPYGGAVGYLTGKGEMDSAVVIRSALVRDGVAQVRAGAGVVADSDPAAEADETRGKASAVLAALGAAA